MRTLRQDVLYALRQLRLSSVFTLTTLLTLALGIGGTTAIFSLIDSVMLKSLPVADPGSLYRVGEGTNCCVQTGPQEAWGLFPYQLYKSIAAAAPEFEQMASAATDPHSTSGSEPFTWYNCDAISRAHPIDAGIPISARNKGLRWHGHSVRRNPESPKQTDNTYRFRVGVRYLLSICLGKADDGKDTFRVSDRAAVLFTPQFGKSNRWRI